MADDIDTDTTATPRRWPTIAPLAIAVFVTLAAAAALFGAGLVVGHHDRSSDQWGGAMHDRGAMTPGGMMGSGDGMMASSGGMMSSMAVASEAEFLAEMIPHHEEAIDSARVLRDGTDRREMRAFADEIIRTQQAEVDDMRTWLKRWHAGTAPATDYRTMMRPDLAELRGDDLDRAFLEDMTMHHMMAVHMSRSLLGTPDAIEHDQVADLARSIDTTQRREIMQMQAWLRDWFGAGGGMMGGGAMHGAR